MAAEKKIRADRDGERLTSIGNRGTGSIASMMFRKMKTPPKTRRWTCGQSRLLAIGACVALTPFLGSASSSSDQSTPVAAATKPADVQPAKEVAFSVVSIRPHGASPGGMLRISSDSYTAANMTLRTIITQAYGVRDDKLLVGGPSWIDSATFDLEAKIDSADLPAIKLTYRQLADMLQPVLADRFHLKVHHEMRDFPVYNLTVAKGGSKLKEFNLANAPKGSSAGCMVNIKSAGFRSAHNCGMSEIAEWFEHPSGRFVVDKTGFPGRYDFEFCYSNERTPEGDPNYDCPTVFTAIQEQLGLKLESGTAALDVLVIDSAERPSNN
jgi:uncharacterized protein (TIGR03435 family)